MFLASFCKEKSVDLDKERVNPSTFFLIIEFFGKQ